MAKQRNYNSFYGAQSARQMEVTKDQITPPEYKYMFTSPQSYYQRRLLQNNNNDTSILPQRMK